MLECPRTMHTTDPDTLALYTYKSVHSRWGKRHVSIDIPRDVFSTFQLDPGTMLLLSQMSRKGGHWPRAADVGCGYGTIGLYLSATGLADDVAGIDRDLLAVVYAQKNAAQLGAKNAVFRPGLAYDALDGQTFDLIVSNIPAKAGEALHRLMLLGASNYLAPAGEAWVVAVQPLEEEVDSIVSDPSVAIAHKHQAKGYVVYNYSFRGTPDQPADPYNRGIRSFGWRNHTYSLKTFWGLPDFDTRSIEIDLILTFLERSRQEYGQVREVLIHNPSQGHIPILATRLMPSIELVRLRSRDLLALRACRHNLEMAGYKGGLAEELSIDLGCSIADKDHSLLIARLEHGLGPALNCRLILQWLKDGLRGRIIIACHNAMANQLMQRLQAHNIRFRRKTNADKFCVFAI
jgi:16S rRNA (guanine1207-N2)-methyltransferase